MSTILVVAFEFAPLASGGVHRAIRMVKQLKDLGHDPIVVTIDHEKVYGPTNCDFSLLKLIPKDVQVCRTDFNSLGVWGKFIQTGYWFAPDAIHLQWKIEFKKQVSLLVQHYQFSAIVVTLPPFSIGKLGIWVKSSFGIPLVVDMRDAWSNWSFAPYATFIHYRKILNQEADLLQSADAVLVTSEQTLKDFLSLHPSINPNKLFYLPNGYQSDFEVVNTQEVKGNKCVQIGYVGSFYYNPVSQQLIDKPWYKKRFYQFFQYVPHKEDWLYRTPFFFFKTLNQLFQIHPEYKEIVRVVFAGTNPEWLNAMIDSFGLSAIVEHRGKVSVEKSFALQQSSDLLLITSAKVKEGLDYSIAGKTFEYFSLQKPIIAFVCAGAQEELLKRSGLALMFDPDDINTAVERFKSLLDNGFKPKPAYNFLSEFGFKQSAKRLGLAIEKVINNSKHLKG